MTDFYRGWKKKSERRRISSWWRGFFAFVGKMIARFFKIKGIFKKLFVTAVFVGLIGFIVFGTLFAYYSFNLPDPDKLVDRPVTESTKIMDRHGKLLYEIYGEKKRTLVSLETIPQHVKDATIAIEDKNFYHHRGISLIGILRSVVVNILTASKSQGGSTITQQFVRNAVLTREKSWARKFKEIALSLQLERKYRKDEILQLYLNEIPYGSNAYGIQAAAQTFFGKDAKDLTLVEAAYLAALPQAPTYYSPFGTRREDLDKRADTVLALMADQGYITKSERNTAQNQPVEFRNIGRGIKAPHFVLYVQDLLAEKYGEISLREEGLKVTTSLDLDLQEQAEKIVTGHVLASEKKYNATNASLVAIDPRSGHLLAMVGSRDYFDKDHDGAVNVALRPRQPGSSFKPYVYAAAFMKGLSPATMLTDVTTNFGEFGGKEYTPQDYDGKNRGPISIRQALQGSLNIPAVKTLLLTGIEDSIETAEDLGITTLKDRSRFGPSLVLGGAEVKLLEHTAAYGVFATNGIKHEVVSILKIEDKNGKVLEEYRESRGQEVLNPQIAYQINHVLSDNAARVFIFGAGNKLHLPGRPVAAKTGTTQEYRDAWTVGYTPSLVTGVWMGNNNNDAMTGGASGSLVAAAIWNDFMKQALDGKPVEDFARPEGIVEMQVDSLSGKLPTTYTPATKTEVFSSFNIPQDYDDVHLSDGITILYSEKPGDPAWDEPVSTWALEHGYGFQQNSGAGTTTDDSIKIRISAPEKITASPWTVRAEVETSDSLREVSFLLDGVIVNSFTAGPFELTSSGTRAKGTHRLTVYAATTSAKANQKSISLDFDQGSELVMLAPADNQILILPANLVVESGLDVNVADVQFAQRTVSGAESMIAGNVAKRKFGEMFQYTLNWPESAKPAAGSYAIYAKIGSRVSGQVTVKIP